VDAAWTNVNICEREARKSIPLYIDNELFTNLDVKLMTNSKFPVAVHTLFWLDGKAAVVSCREGSATGCGGWVFVPVDLGRSDSDGRAMSRGKTAHPIISYAFRC
jgi:hypothetical protein